jgi:hypothetical protein
MDKKLSYHDLLKLFFGQESGEFQLPEQDQKKLANIRGYLKELALKEDKRIYSLIEWLYGSLPENRFFQEDAIMEEIAELFARRNFPVKKIVENIQVMTQNGPINFDVMAYNETAAVVINLFSTVDSTDIDEFATALVQFKLHFPEFSGLKIYGALGVIEILPEKFRQANAKGLYVLRKTGDSIKILNRKNFRATSW